MVILQELSIVPDEIKILTPCLAMLPSTFYGIEDKEIRYNARYLDMIINPNVRDIFVKRHKIINFIRTYLVDRNFIEVETPVLSDMAGGAAAKPFTTYLNEAKRSMYMRIAPELFLPQLVIGGLDRVFEIGKQFRNESCDVTHNPEFTSIELYQTGVDYNNLMDMTEDLLSNLAQKVNGTTQVTWMETPIDLAGPYPRLDIMDTLQMEISKKLADPDEQAGEIFKDSRTLRSLEHRKLVLKFVREHFPQARF